MDVPMAENTRLREEELKDAASNGKLITFTPSKGSKRFWVEKGITRFCG